MEKVIIGFILLLVGFSAVLVVLQMRARTKISKAIYLIIKWFDYIIAHPNDFDLGVTRELAQKVDEYLSSKEVGKKEMFFAPKLKSYIVDRYGKLPGESDDEAFARLAQWEEESVRLDVYWTLIQGSFAEYADGLKKGKNPTFAGVSAPIAILRKYWGI
ncbi:MAG TPA: hypothetical protein ENN07_07100 [candidate division Zixibacteria bacterium]|nr:hypothetical protein [candidate division Zixibacteria bacterium]